MERITFEQLGNAGGCIDADRGIVERAPAREPLIRFGDACLRFSVPIADYGEIDIADAGYALARSQASAQIDRAYGRRLLQPPHGHAGQEAIDGAVNPGDWRNGSGDDETSQKGFGSHPLVSWP